MEQLRLSTEASNTPKPATPSFALEARRTGTLEGRRMNGRNNPTPEPRDLESGGQTDELLGHRQGPHATAHTIAAGT